MPKPGFWERVVFYNYLQAFAGPQAGHRPRREQWADPLSASAFQTVLDTYEPDRILVLGKSTWAHRPVDPATLISAPEMEHGLPLPQRFHGRQEADGFACWYTSHTGKRALAMPILHPAAHGFHVAEWAGLVQTWLQFASEPASAESNGHSNGNNKGALRCSGRSSDTSPPAGSSGTPWRLRMQTDLQ